MHALLLPLLVLAAQDVDARERVDTDGDGLSDFREIHKHRTDPHSADSDGDGLPDGDPDERREWTYTLRTVIQVMPPVTPRELEDDWQDARVLDVTDDYVELEVIHYPLGTAHRAIEGDPAWREEQGGLERWLAPGPTANWDAELAAAIRAGLGADGIDVDALDDKALVERASRWLLERAPSSDGFTTWACELDPDGPPGTVRVRPELRAEVERRAAEVGRTVEEQWRRELFAKDMFETGARGTCTSTAIYLNGCLRALGVPTRTVLCTPLIDASDERERALVERIRHPRVRRIARAGLAGLERSWASHTFNEVWVGGRWRRLNGDRLGQPILDAGLFGVTTHVATFSDWTDAGMAPTWGRRGMRGRVEDDTFGGTNPYSTIALSDRFGEHSGLDPAALAEDDELRVLTIERAYWYDDPAKDPAVAMRLDDAAAAGHVLVHVREHRAGEGTAQYRPFYERADKRFELRSPGRPAVPLHAARGWWTVEERDVREFYLRIAPDDLERMADGVEYALVALDEDGDWRFTVADGVTLSR